MNQGSMTPEIENHCRDILGDRRIRQKVVILCEGGTDRRGRLSPQSYRQNDRLPDANFYRACVPRWWKSQRQRLPQFINSGDRSKVLNTYFGLLELHNRHPKQSYLDPQKLFALVDLDLQGKRLDYYTYPSLDKIFQALYHYSNFQTTNVKPDHHIFVTGLVHKEAYYLLPEMQDLFKKQRVYFNHQPLFLGELYRTIVEEADSDRDLVTHFHQVKYRLKPDLNLTTRSVSEFQNAWLSQFDQTQPDPTSVSPQPPNRDLIYSLFLLCKAKPYWRQIQPCPGDSRTPDQLQDQLMTSIANVYAYQFPSPKHHIPCLFQAIYEIAYP